MNGCKQTARAASEEDRHGDTPLSLVGDCFSLNGIRGEKIAKMKGLLQFLIKNGADPLKKNRYGVSPLDKIRASSLYKKEIKAIEEVIL